MSQFILDIQWDEGVDLPRLVGPFATRAEAAEWARLNIPNGTSEVAPLAYPYALPKVRIGADS